jgi:hypothetical protein
VKPAFNKNLPKIRGMSETLRCLKQHQNEYKKSTGECISIRKGITGKWKI